MSVGQVARGGGMIIDAHHHLWSLAKGYRWLDEPELAPIRRDFGVPELRAELAAAGVGRTVLVEAGRFDRAEVAEFLGIAAATEEIAGVVGWVDLTDPGLAEHLAAARAGRGGAKLVGVRAQVQGEPDPEYLRRTDVQRGLSIVADAGLAYDLVVRVEQLPAARRSSRGQRCVPMPSRISVSVRLICSRRASRCVPTVGVWHPPST
jgi:L-fuconolactonase